MTKSVKRQSFSRGKGVLSATGPQARFIVFLIFLLIGYTLLLKIFQKLSGIVELPVFLPIALISLLAYIGIAGILYSHKFAGPIIRISKTLEHVAQGDCSVSLRLRDSDDPLMKELAETVTRLCEQSRLNHRMLHETAGNFLHELAELTGSIRKNGPGADMEARLARLQQQQAAFEQALNSLGR